MPKTMTEQFTGLACLISIPWVPGTDLRALSLVASSFTAEPCYSHMLVVSVVVVCLFLFYFFSRQGSMSVGSSGVPESAA